MNQLREASLTNTCLWTPYGKTNSQFSAEFDPSTGAIWGYFNPKGTACFSLGPLKDIRNHDSALETNAWHVNFEGAMHKVNYCYGLAHAARVQPGWRPRPVRAADQVARPRGGTTPSCA